MATNGKPTIVASGVKEPPDLNPAHTPTLTTNHTHNVADGSDDDNDGFHSQSKLARTHLKLSDLCIQDDLVYQSISDTGLSVTKHKHLAMSPPLLSEDPAITLRYPGASKGTQSAESKCDARSVGQCGSVSHDTTFHAKSFQTTYFSCNSGRKWLKRPASDKEDALASSVQSKQASGSLKWASPTQDGLSEGSIQASSQLLQEHVVLLDLDATSGKDSTISLVTSDVWPHLTEDLASESSYGNDKEQEINEVVELNEENIPTDHSSMRNTTMPYSPGDVIKRLSPIFDEPGSATSLNDSSPEQIVPSENHVLKPSNLDHKNMYDTDSSENSPQGSSTSYISHFDKNPSLSSQSVPDVSVCNTEDRVAGSNLVNASQVKAKNQANTSDEPHYEIYSLCSDMDLEYQSDKEQNNDSYQVSIKASVSPNTSCSTIMKEVQKLSIESGGSTKHSGTDSDGRICCQLLDVEQKSSGNNLLKTNQCDGAVGGASPTYSSYSTTDSDSSSESGRIPLIELLPEELIFKILFYLSPQELSVSVASISRKWRDYAYDPILWQFLDLSHHPNISSVHLCRLLRRAKLLKSLNLRGRQELNVTEMKLLGHHCAMLQEINLGFCENLSEAAIQAIVYHCKSLTTVNVEGCETVDNTAALNFTFLPELRVLNMSHCTKITDEVIIHIAVLCEKLEALNIDGIPWISDSAVQCLASERCSTLEAVFLDGAELTDDSIENLTACTKLHTLSISFCEEFTDKSLNFLMKINAPKHLRLKRGVEFTEPALADLFLADNLASLTYLNLTECSELCDRGVQNLARMCRRLQHLALCWCWDISDVGLESIVDNCSHLEVLDLLGLNKIRGKCLDRIPQALPFLKFLDLRQCNMIQDSMLVNLVTIKKDLSILNYYGEEVKVCACKDDKLESSSCPNAANPLIEH